MKPSIAYILKMYPRFSETFIVNEILELERQGVDVRIYSLRKPDDGRFHASLAKVRANVIYVPQYPEMEPERIRQAHQQLQQLRPQSYRVVHQKTQAKGHRYAIKRFLQAGYIANHLLAHPVDAMHAHFASSATRAANIVHQLTGIPYSFTAHAKDIFHEEVVPASLVEKIKSARFVVTVSRYNQAYLERMVSEYEKDDRPADIRCLYNGINLKKFKPSSRIRRDPAHILGVGRLVEKKGFDVLIRACALLRDQGRSFTCEIIGKGDQQEKLENLIQHFQLEKHIRLSGPRAQDDVLRAYHQSAVFALPCVIGSDNNQDGLPTVLLEAMATGMPVVSTTLTGNPEIIDDGVNGFLTEPGDAAGLAQALARLLDSPELQQRMGEAGRQKAMNTFNVRKNVAVLHRFFRESTDLVEPESGQPLTEPIWIGQGLESPMTLDAIFSKL